MRKDGRSANDPRNQLHTLFQAIEGIVWEADTSMLQFTFVSDHVQSILGFYADTWMQSPGFWEAHIHPDDRSVIADYRNLKNLASPGHSFEYRMIRADGNIVWIKDNVSLVQEGDRAPILRGIMLETTIVRRLSALEQLEEKLFRLNSDIHISLQELLLSYLTGLENLFPQMQCSIHRVKNDRLHNGISPSLPLAYMAALENVPDGENQGSCGAAAALKQQVIVSDIATDPKWVSYRQLAMGYGLQACWSNPVINTDGEVMATLGMYYREPKLPQQEELRVIERATTLLRIILENRQKTEMISETNLLMMQSQELAHFGNWRWDVQYNIVTWSPALYTIYGLNPQNFKATFEGYQELLHPEDRLRVYNTITNVLQTKNDAEFVEKIIRPNGEVRHLRSWAKLKVDEQGRPLEMIGACLDITERINTFAALEQQNQKLREIAWMQSHVIRSPLANIMGLVELLKDAFVNEHDVEKSKLLDHLLASAHDLDERIRTISEKASL